MIANEKLMISKNKAAYDKLPFLRTGVELINIYITAKYTKVYFF